MSSGRNGNPVFYIGEGDTFPPLDCALFGGQDTTPVNLTGATVVFVFSDLGGAERFTRAATVLDAANGRVRHQWNAGDTDTPGTYLGRFVVTFSSGKVQSFPNDRYIDVEVT